MNIKTNNNYILYLIYNNVTKSVILYIVRLEVATVHINFNNHNNHSIFGSKTDQKNKMNTKLKYLQQNNYLDLSFNYF
jgi:hypothetical protein